MVQVRAVRGNASTLAARFRGTPQHPANPVAHLRRLTSWVHYPPAPPCHMANRAAKSIEAC
jgi:hypothetical protein